MHFNVAKHNNVGHLQQSEDVEHLNTCPVPPSSIGQVHLTSISARFILGLSKSIYSESHIYLSVQCVAVHSLQYYLANIGREVSEFKMPLVRRWF